MKVGIRAKTQEIAQQIIEDYFEGPLSVAALMEKYGRSESSVNKLIANYKKQYEAEHGEPRRRVGKPRDPRLTEEKKCLSIRHGFIGLAVTRYMTENKLSPTEFGMLISRSRFQVRDIERGCYNLTLIEIERISEIIGVPMEVLLSATPSDKGVQLRAVS